MRGWGHCQGCTGTPSSWGPSLLPESSSPGPKPCSIVPAMSPPKPSCGTHGHRAAPRPCRGCHCQHTHATSSPGEQTGPSRHARCHCTPAASIHTLQGHSMPALCHPGAHHSSLDVSPPPRDEGKLRQMLQRGARKGRFRLRVPAAAKGNWQPAGDGMEAAEGRELGGPRGADGDTIPQGGQGGQGWFWAKIGGKKEKIQIGACKGFVQRCWLVLHLPGAAGHGSRQWGPG